MREHPIFQAISQHMRLDIIHYVTHEPFCLHERNDKGDTPLIHAVREYDMPLDIIQQLVEKGADVNAKNDMNSTALIWAALREETEVICYLIEQGAEIDAMDEDGDCFYSLISEEPMDLPYNWILEHGNFSSERTKKPFKSLRLEKLFQ